MTFLHEAIAAVASIMNLSMMTRGLVQLCNNVTLDKNLFVSFFFIGMEMQFMTLLFYGAVNKHCRDAFISLLFTRTLLTTTIACKIMHSALIAFATRVIGLPDVFEDLDPVLWWLAAVLYGPIDVMPYFLRCDIRRCGSIEQVRNSSAVVVTFPNDANTCIGCALRRYGDTMLRTSDGRYYHLKCYTW